MVTNTPWKDEKSYRWKILIVAYLASFTFGLTLQSVPPILSLLIQEFQLTHAEAGLTMSLFALPMVFFSVPAGMMADRQGPKRVGLAAFSLTIVGTLVVAFSPSFPLLLVGRALAGMGAFTLAVIGPQLVSQWFLGKEVGLALGIWNTAFPLGVILSFNTLGSLGQALGWRGPILVSAGFAALSIVVFGLLARPSPSAGEDQRRHGPASYNIFRAGLAIWLVGIAWLFSASSSMAFMAFAPDYFQAAGYTVALAGLLSSMVLWGAFLVTPLVGLLLYRGMSKEGLVFVGGLGLALGLAVLSVNPSLAVPSLLLMAIASSLTVVPVFALPPTLLEPRLLGLGYGILSTCLNAGTVLGPLLAGLARDLTGAYTASLWVMAAMALLISVTIVPLRTSRRAALAPTASPG